MALGKLQKSFTKTILSSLCAATILRPLWPTSSRPINLATSYCGDVRFRSGGPPSNLTACRSRIGDPSIGSCSSSGPAYASGSRGDKEARVIIAIETAIIDKPPVGSIAEAGRSNRGLGLGNGCMHPVHAAETMERCWHCPICGTRTSAANRTAHERLQ